LAQLNHKEEKLVDSPDVVAQATKPDKGLLVDSLWFLVLVYVCQPSQRLKPAPNIYYFYYPVSGRV
jgi:hypothetical protein